MERLLHVAMLKIDVMFLKMWLMIICSMHAKMLHADVPRLNHGPGRPTGYARKYEYAVTFTQVLFFTLASIHLFLLLLKSHTRFRNRAPAHSTGAKCLDMLKPKSDANQSMVVTAIGARRSSVW